MMKRVSRNTFIAAAVLLCSFGFSNRANAAAIAAICDDLGCTGGNDFFVTDNLAGDTIGALGAINFTASAFGFSIVVNTSQTKPILGSATMPQLDLTFSATTGTVGSNTVFIYLSDTDFLNAQSFLLTLGGTNSGGSGTVTGRAWGGTSNTALVFSGANLLGSTGALTGTPFTGSASGALSPTVNPYSLTIGVAITRTTAGTSTGDLNLSTSAVPEPASMTLFGLGLMGLSFAAYRRNAKNR